MRLSYGLKILVAGQVANTDEIFLTHQSYYHKMAKK